MRIHHIGTNHKRLCAIDACRPLAPPRHRLLSMDHLILHAMVELEFCIETNHAP